MRFLLTVALLATSLFGSPATAQGTATADEKRSEWELKPRWRLQYDWADIDGPPGLPGLGSSEEIRRAQLGIDLKMPGGFSARIEGEFTDDPIALVDAYVAWNRGGISVTAGQHKFSSPLDDMTSDLNTSFAERAALVTAFNFSRRTGVSAGYASGDFQVSAGVGTDLLIQLNDVGANSVSADVRAVWSPRLSDTKLHFGAAYHRRDRRDSAAQPLRYRQRPLVHSADIRYVATPGLLADKEQTFGIEAAAVRGRWHAAGEGYWHRPRLAGTADPTFFGGYAETGLFLTNDTRPLKGGAFGAIKPEKPLGKGGIGAVQINLRYDYLDLNSAGVRGGTQRGYLASLIWTPTGYLRLIAEYARLDYRGAAIAVGGNRDYGVDVVGARVQLSY